MSEGESIDPRKGIKDSLRKFAMILDDARSDNTVVLQQPGLDDITLHTFTPESLERTSTSWEKPKALQPLRDAFGMTTLTAQFQEIIMKDISVSYDFGLLSSKDALKLLGVDFNTDDLGIFEPGKAHEAEKERLAHELSEALGLARSGFTEKDGKLTPLFPMFGMLEMMLKKAARAIEWADSFGVVYNDNTFSELVDYLRPMLQFIKPSEAT